MELDTRELCRVVGGEVKNTRQFGVMMDVDVCSVNDKDFAIGSPHEMAEGPNGLEFDDNVVMVEDHNGSSITMMHVDDAEYFETGMDGADSLVLQGRGGRVDIASEGHSVF